MALTTSEVADLLGVTSSAVRTMVLRKQLVPIRAGARPLWFRETAVWELSAARRKPDDQAAARAAWAAICAEIPV